MDRINHAVTPNAECPTIAHSKSAHSHHIQSGRGFPKRKKQTKWCFFHLVCSGGPQHTIFELFYAGSQTTSEFDKNSVAGQFSQHLLNIDTEPLSSHPQSRPKPSPITGITGVIPCLLLCCFLQLISFMVSLDITRT